MGRIQSTVGLITGMDIESTVTSLMELAARPKDLLQTRTDGLKEEQIAFTELSALLLSTQYITDNLGKTDLFNTQSVSSGDSSLLKATLTGEPAKGTYQFTPIQTAQAHQLLSTGLKSSSDALEEGELTLRFGDDLLRSTSLDLLDGGEGVGAGSIRITDRSGASAEIDLTTARDVDDVLTAINTNGDIGVTASAEGDRIRLTDNTGQAVSNLKVQEVSGGTVAEALGLDGIDAAADSADGRDMLWLTSGLDLEVLNDGNGVRRNTALDDIEYQLRDGTQGTIDLSPIVAGGSDVDAETTLGEILDAINAVEPGKLKVEIAADGDRLVLTDMTEGAGDFSVQSMFGSGALADLGLDGAAVDGVITGQRIVGGMQTSLLSSLNGGAGLGDLGALELTDRNGASATVDLTGAETVDELLQRINAAGVEIEARVNDARNGILLSDTSGSVSGNLVVANGDATNTADKLQIAVDAATARVDSGDLHLQVVNNDTLLDSLHGGSGIQHGKISFVDSAGEQATLELKADEHETIGDVVRAINLLGVQVEARINDTGDGIVVEDLAQGSGTLEISDQGGTTAAKDLHLAGSATTVEIEGQSTQIIDGAMTHTLELDGTTSLEDLVEQINSLEAGIQATILNDGSSNPYHLSLTSEQSGKIGRLVVDASQFGVSFGETIGAQDALMSIGGAESGLLVASATNVFSEVLSGVSVEIKGTSTSPVTVTVETDNTNLKANVRTFVDNYNAFRERLDEMREYDADTDSASVLTGDTTALRLETDLSQLLTGRFVGAGSIQSLGELGVRVTDDGTLEFEETKFVALYAEDPDAIETFFTEETNGFSAKFKTLSEQLTGSEYSLLDYRLTVLGNKVDTNEAKIESMAERLENQRELLYMQFYQMEFAVSKMQSSLSVLDSIEPLTIEKK